MCMQNHLNDIPENPSDVRLRPWLPGDAEPSARLYMSAFPEDERRPLSEWEAMRCDEPKFDFRTVERDGTFVGFITSWALDGFRYVEHFAIEKTCRGGGVGSMALRIFLKNYPELPIVLEVEPPLTDMARRRIRFYEALGFRCLPDAYEQPPYRPGGEWLPLVLMVYPAAFAAGQPNVEHISKKLHKYVYGRDK